MIYRKCKTLDNLQQYKKAQNKAVAKFRQAKKDFEKKLTKQIKSDPKSFYAYVRSKSKIRDVIGPLRDSSNNLVTDDAKMCDVLNSLSGSVFTKEQLDSNTPEAKERFNKEECYMLKDLEITPEKIISKITKLKENKSPGIDNIVPTILKRVANDITSPLCTIFRKLLDTGQVPDSWKCAM